MRSDGVVVFAPALDQHFGLAQRHEYLTIQKLVSELRVQALAIAILPWASRFYVERLDADPAEPLPHIDRDKFWAIAHQELARRRP